MFYVLLWGAGWSLFATTGLRATLFLSTPDIRGCSPIKPPANFTGSWAVLVQRGNCSFSAKAFAAQRAGAAAVIIFDDVDEDLIEMGGDSDVAIVAVFISRDDGELLQEYAEQQGSTVTIWQNDDIFGVWPTFVLPFMIMMLVTASIYGVYLVYRHRRMLRANRMLEPEVITIPTRPYKMSADQQEPDTCAVCIEEFAVGENLRVLPCNHLFHDACIVPWLTQQRSTCPICKRDVRTGRSSGAGVSTPTVMVAGERTPLLRGSTSTGQTANSLPPSIPPLPASVSEQNSRLTPSLSQIQNTV
ncbi:hypothetical protein, variant 1 [Capsaspora owczarzaki ATCC 30864]|uniref:RING-type domain-containing protein n=1 Tax=Capsaspora owczarzaki (strain ATCC 30864) TaxID=595528 RepID=A0A0D2WLK6_CAPO3|nr:hypothetical protein, variant 1 [Capsaspora owczarzaki ATCC 30864]